MKHTTEVYDLVSDNLKKINCCRGGSSSSKTWTLNQIVIEWLMTGLIGGKLYHGKDGLGNKIPLNKGVFLVTRETFPSLRKTVLKEFKHLLYEYGQMPFLDWKRATHEFIFEDREVIFMSLDDETKVLGLRTSFFWINEGNSVPYEIFKQLLRRCSGKCFLDYNPWNPGGWINQEIEMKRMPDRGDVGLVKSTYLMNPFLEESIVKELEGYKDTDPDAYLVYTKGEWAKLTGLVYPKWDYFDVEEPEGRTAYGLDFGFNHATALIKVTKTEDRKLYWDQIIYETEITPNDTIGLLKDMNFSKRWLILADESRPDSIEEIRRAGYKIKKSKKGKVFTGITAIKKYKLFMRGEKLISEAKMYRWKEDTDRESEDRQKLVDEPVKKLDDAMDAGRYGSLKLIRAVTFKY